MEFATIGIIVAAAFVLLSNMIKILKEYERGVVFLLGRFQKVKGPGLIILIPFIAGISYEVLRAAAGHKWLAWASRPGIWIQSITTKEPDDSMVEVAVVSLVAALSDDEVAAVKARGPITGAALTAQYDIEADPDG